MKLEQRYTPQTTTGGKKITSHTRQGEPAAAEHAEWWLARRNQPAGWITEDMVQSAIHDVSRKNAVPTLAGIRLLPLVEGTCVQILHIGSYDAETPTLDRLHNHYLPEHGLTFNGDHHEIYLSGARRTPPAKLKTILRQPVKTVQRAGTAPAGPANGTGLP